MTDMTISDAVSAFRKFSRDYKAFEYAETVFEALAKVDELTRNAEAKAFAAKEEETKILADLEVVSNKLNTLYLTQKELQEEIKNLTVYKQAEAEKIISEAKGKAANIVEVAEATRAKIKEEVSEYNIKRVNLINSCNSVKAELQELTNKVSSERQRLIKAFSE